MGKFGICLPDSAQTPKATLATARKTDNCTFFVQVPAE